MTDYHGNDIYCDLIVPRKLNVTIVKETRNVLAFYHTKPRWSVHIVVTCKSHVPSLLELDSELAIELLDVVKDVAAKIKEKERSCRVLTNIGEYQDSKHLHFHVLGGLPLDDSS